MGGSVGYSLYTFSLSVQDKNTEENNWQMDYAALCTYILPQKEKKKTKMNPSLSVLCHLDNHRMNETRAIKKEELRCEEYGVV